MRNETMTVGELIEKVNCGMIKSDIDLQREIVYNEEKQRLVIDSLVSGVPLPAFYFWEEEDGSLETLDGKQRIHAITRFKHNDLEYDKQIWMETSQDIQKKIDAVELSCIVCSGTDKLRREIFKRINTLGVPLSEYEVLNGLFNGEYLRGLTKYVADDKHASKILGEAARGKRQIVALKQLIKCKGLKVSINDYVNDRKEASFAEDQRYIDKYVSFIADVFPDKPNLDIRFSIAYDHAKDRTLWKKYSKEIQKEIKQYMKTDDWKLTGDKKGDILAICMGIVGNTTLDTRRLFTSDQKKELLSKADKNSDGLFRCAGCGDYFSVDELQIDHIKPWAKGGRTELSNGQLMCRTCNNDKGVSYQ